MNLYIDVYIDGNENEFWTCMQGNQLAKLEDWKKE